MFKLKYTILLFLSISLTIRGEVSRVDSIYKALNEDQKLAQLFVVSDSVNIDSTLISNLPAPAYFIFSGKKVGNFRRAKAQEFNHSLSVCSLLDGKMNGVNSQGLPGDRLLEAAQLSGNSSNYLPYLVQKAKSAGANGFLFDFTSPWAKSQDLKELIKSSKRFISKEYPTHKGLTLSGQSGFLYIDIFSFPSDLFDKIDQVPLQHDKTPILEQTFPGEKNEEKTLLTNILNGEGLLYSTNYNRDFNLLKEAISNNLLPQSVLEKAIRNSIANRVSAGKSLSGKSMINERVQELTIARQGVTLIANEKLFLPLQNIDSLKIVLLTLDGDNFDKLYISLKFYTPNCTQISVAALDSATIARTIGRVKAANLIIIASAQQPNIDLSKRQDVENLRRIVGKKNTLLLTFGPTTDLIAAKELLPLKAVVAGYDNSAITQQIIGENLMGGGAFMGKSPMVVKGICDKGQGITYQASRLGKAVPEEQGMSSETLARIDDIISMAMAEHAMPGCEILVARKEKIVFQKAYGSYSYDPYNAITDTSIYDLASVTKIIGSLPMIMRLTDEGTIKLENRLETYLPNLKTTNKGDLKLIEILTHQAGLVPFIPFYQNTFDKKLTDGNLFSNKYSDKYSVKVDEHLFFNRYAVYRQDLISPTPSDVYALKVARDMYINKSYVDSIYAQLDSSKIHTRGKYVYSDCGYYYFKKIIEQNGHHSLDTLLNSLHLQPLGMFRTAYNPLNKFPLEQIAPTEQDLMFRKQTVRGYVHDPGAAMLGGVGGHAGLFSTASDLAIMMQMYLNGGTYGGKRYISEATLKRFTAYVSPNSRRGIGFDKREQSPKKINPVSDYCSPQSFGHSGFSGTLVWADPKYDLVYIFLSNRIHPNAYNKKLIKMNIRSRVQDVIYQSIHE